MRRHAGLAALLLVLVVTSAGCHTALHRPPRLAQWTEDRYGDAVDLCGRSTPISNQRCDHRVTRIFESNPVTRHLGEHVSTGGYYSHPERYQGCQPCWYGDCR
jgi:hypothetical protein